MEKKKYWIKDLTSNQVINAPTKKIAKKLLKKFRELGLKWRNGEPYGKVTGWSVFGVDTCYRPFDGKFGDTWCYSDQEILTIDQLLDFNRITNEQADRFIKLMKDWHKDAFNYIPIEQRNNWFVYNKVTADTPPLDQNYLESAEYYANIAALWIDKLPDDDRYKRVKDLARRFHGAIVDELSVNNLK